MRMQTCRRLGLATVLLLPFASISCSSEEPETATIYYAEWATNSRFGITEERLKKDPQILTFVEDPKETEELKDILKINLMTTQKFPAHRVDLRLYIVIEGSNSGPEEIFSDGLQACRKSTGLCRLIDEDFRREIDEFISFDGRPID